jgi:hypothetical protein
MPRSAQRGLRSFTFWCPKLKEDRLRRLSNPSSQTKGLLCHFSHDAACSSASAAAGEALAFRRPAALSPGDDDRYARSRIRLCLCPNPGTPTSDVAREYGAHFRFAVFGWVLRPISSFGIAAFRDLRWYELRALFYESGGIPVKRLR